MATKTKKITSVRKGDIYEVQQQMMCAGLTIR